MKNLILVSLPSLIFLGSCVVPESTHVKPDFYLLAPISEDRNQTDFDTENSFYVNQVQVPRYLQDNRLVCRLREESVEFRESHRWGEPLEEGIARVLGSNLDAFWEAFRDRGSADLYFTKTCYLLFLSHIRAMRKDPKIALFRYPSFLRPLRSGFRRPFLELSAPI